MNSAVPRPDRPIAVYKFILPAVYALAAFLLAAWGVGHGPGPHLAEFLTLPASLLVPAIMTLSGMDWLPSLLGLGVLQYAVAGVLLDRGIRRRAAKAALGQRCAGCSYSLEGLKGDRCPECGRLIRTDKQPDTNG